MKPSNHEFAEIFDGIAPQYNEVSNSYAVYRRKTIIGNWAKGKCLEVGAGTGEISKYLAKNHAVVATDISPGMVEEIKKNRIESYVCDAENLPFQNSSFDSIVSAEMIFYLDNPDNFLSEAYRVLKPGGRLLLSCASNFPVKFYDRLRSYFRDKGFRKGMCCEDQLRDFMTSSKLKAMLQRNKFEIIEEKRAPVIPIRAFDSVNKILEKTPLKIFGIFIFIYAEKHV